MTYKGRNRENKKIKETNFNQYVRCRATEKIKIQIEVTYLNKDV